MPLNSQTLYRYKNILLKGIGDCLILTTANLFGKGKYTHGEPIHNTISQLSGQNEVWVMVKILVY